MSGARKPLTWRGMALAIPVPLGLLGIVMVYVMERAYEHARISMDHEQAADADPPGDASPQEQHGPEE